jgi:hypothetical protein
MDWIQLTISGCYDHDEPYGSKDDGEFIEQYWTVIFSSRSVLHEVN